MFRRHWLLGVSVRLCVATGLCAAIALLLATSEGYAQSGLVLKYDAITSFGGLTRSSQFIEGGTLGEVGSGKLSGPNVVIVIGFWRGPGFPPLVGVDQEGAPLGNLNAFFVSAPTPNPFREHALVRLTLPEAVPRLSARVFDVSGRLIKVLVDGPRTSGTYSLTWNGMSDTDTPAAAGIFFLRITAGQFLSTRRIVRLR